MDSGSPATVFWEEKIYLIGRARKQSRINMKNKERNGGGAKLVTSWFILVVYLSHPLEIKTKKE